MVYSDQVLTQKENNYIAALCFSKDRGGIAFLDVSTGEFKVAEGDLDYLDLLIADFAPKELLVQKGFEKGVKERFTNPASNIYISTMEGWAFVFESGYRKLIKHFKTDSLKGFGVESLRLGVTAWGPAVLLRVEPPGGHRIHTGPDIGPDKHHIPHRRGRLRLAGPLHRP